MLDYLKKFNNLPQDLRDKFAAPDLLARVSAIEKKYDVSLATVIMRVLIKDIAMVDLAKFLVFEFSLDPRRAEKLVEEMSNEIFVVAAEYLGLYNEKTVDILEQVDVVNDRAMELAREKMAIRTSSFFFSPDDEKEIQELTQRVAAHKEAEKIRLANEGPQAIVQRQPQPMEKKMDDVMQKVDVNFSSEDLDNRFKNIIETYLRGVRNRIDIKQALIKDMKVGGLSLSEATINEIIDKIDEVKRKYEEPGLVLPLPSSRLLERPGIKPELGARDAEYDFSHLKKNASADGASPSLGIENREIAERNLPKIKSTFKNFSFIDDLDPVASNTPESITEPIVTYNNNNMKKMAIDAKDDLLRSIGERAKKIEQNQASSVSGQTKKLIDDTKKTVLSRPVSQLQVDNKKRMDDVKYVPKLVSPIEELRIMNLVNFRRLSQDSHNAKEQIREKIVFLEEDSYAKRLEGIKAWRQSPLNKLYITIGQEAISKEGGIRAIIKERQTAGQDFLTEAEFDAIMDLNKNLRF